MCCDVKQADTCWHGASFRPAPSQPGHMYSVAPCWLESLWQQGVISHAYDGNVQKQDRFHIVCVCVCVCVYVC